MKAVIQRVKNARVVVDETTVSQIGRGLLVYLSVGKEDGRKQAEFIAKKIVDLRIFEDDKNKMNRSVKDVSGAVLLVSNFTLHGDCKKGRRPSFDAAAGPSLAKELYEDVAKLISYQGVVVKKGVFAAHMHVESVNDGPVTFVLDSVG